MTSSPVPLARGFQEHPFLKEVSHVVDELFWAFGAKQLHQLLLLVEQALQVGTKRVQFHGKRGRRSSIGSGQANIGLL
jgi:hypothetical protein